TGAVPRSSILGSETQIVVERPLLEQREPPSTPFASVHQWGRRRRGAPTGIHLAHPKSARRRLVVRDDGPRHWPGSNQLDPDCATDQPGARSRVTRTTAASLDD